MKKWRKAENEWNLKSAPIHGAEMIEEVDDELAVPSIICVFYRGNEYADHVVKLHNDWVDKQDETEAR